MEIELLKTFQKVVEYGSISKAADATYLSVSTVTSRIKALERQLGIELFHRNGRRLDISLDGKSFIKYVERFFSILDEGREKIALTSQQFYGELKIAVSSNITNYILPQLVKNFRKKYPQINLKVVLSSNYKLVDRISNGHMELGIANHVVNEGGLKSQIWFKDRIVPVLPQFHPLTTLNTLKPKDIESYPFIGYERHTRKWKVIKNWFESAGVKPNVVIEVNEVGLVKKFLPKINGISFLPYISVKNEIESGELVMAKVNPLLANRDTVFIYKKNLDLSQAARVFIEFGIDYYHLEFGEEGHREDEHDGNSQSTNIRASSSLSKL